MECRRQLDLAGRTSAGRPLILSAILLLLLLPPLAAAGGAAGAPPDRAPALQQLLTEGRWQEVIDLVEPLLPAASPAELPDLQFLYGSALAQLRRLDEARAAFLAGYRLQPNDKRFAVELGGVAFKQELYPQAAAWLRRALHLDPSDSYANHFLGTVYFLQGNTKAALKYWNRVGKPQIENVRPAADLRLRPALLDRAFAFSPAATLTLPELLTSEARLRHLEVFPSFAFDLAARPDGNFDVEFRARELHGMGRNKWEGLFRFFRGIFQQTVYPEFFNLRGSATNVVSLLRWDAEKRRAWLSLSGPLRQNPKWRYRLSLDLRNENWDIRDSFTGPAPLRAALNLRREAVSAQVISVHSGRWRWSTGAEFSHRDYRRVVPGDVLDSRVLAQGNQLKHLAQVDHELFRLPERRLVVRAALSSQAGRLWSNPPHSFLKVQSSLAAHWLPQPRGDDFETYAAIYAGKTLGGAPFDELFLLAFERDNDLWLRAHPGTRDGRRGSAPLGRNYFLVNWEIDKNVYKGKLFTVKLGPFLDTGTITDSSPGLGSRKWLWDTGAQAKLFAFGFGVVFAYGKDLRSGNNAFALRLARTLPQQ